MSTTTPSPEKKSQTSISNEAYELFDCFVDELDDVVYDLSEALAKQRGDYTKDGLVSIEIQDVKRAAELLFEALKRDIQAGNMPKNLGPVVEEMSSCLESRVKEHGS